jgi:lysine-specific demethylase 8
MSTQPVIERITAPSPAEFQQRYVRTSTPVIITGMMSDWPAWRHWSLDYFARRFGDRLVTAGRTKGGVLEMSDKDGIPQVEIAFGRYVEMLRDGRPDCYLLSPVHERLPELLDDLVWPEPCRQARWRTTRLWVSGADTCSPLHRDWPENLNAQVFGRKRYLMVHRRETRRVYSRPFYSGVPNFSRLDAEHPDYEQFPKFRDVPRVSFELNAGEILYIPRLWWHQVRSLETSASISFWFANGLVAAAAMFSQLYAKARGLRI